MKIIPCKGCGVVLDESHLPFPNEEEMWSDEQHGYDPDKSVWCSRRDEFVPIVPCPVCGEMIEK